MTSNSEVTLEASEVDVVLDQEPELVPEEEVVPEETVGVFCQPIYLTPQCVMVGLGDSQKGEFQKAISYEDFYDLLSQMMSKVSMEATAKLLLPSNCFFLAYSNNTLNINVYYPECNMKIPYGKVFTGRVPNMILSFKLTRAKVKEGWTMSQENVRYFCTDVPVSLLPKEFIEAPNPSKRIFVSPFWNTYGDGRMCLGGNMTPGNFTKGNLRGLDYYYQVLFNSPFNNDLGVRAVTSASVNTWDKELAKAAKEEAFPYNLLNGFTPLS